MKILKKLIPFFLVVLASVIIWFLVLYFEVYFPYRYSKFYPTLSFLVWVIIISIIFLKFFKTVKEFVLYFFVFLFIYSFFIFILNLFDHIWYEKYCSNRILDEKVKLRKELLKN